ncbi:hypothetical protein ACOMHN_018467 [Nucella lapillus]
MLTNNSSYLSLTANDLAQCTDENRTAKIELERKELIIVYSQNQTNHNKSTINNTSRPGLSCWFNVTSSTDHVIQIQFLHQTCSRDKFLSLIIQVNDTSEFLDTRTGCQHLRSPLLVDFLSRRHYVLFAFVINDLHLAYNIKVKVITVTSDSKAQLQLQYLSPKMGILQSPGFNPAAGVTYPAFSGHIDSTAWIWIPPDHVMMSSFLYVNLKTAYRYQLRFYLTNDSLGESTSSLDFGAHPHRKAYEKSGQSLHGPFMFPFRSDPVTVLYEVKAEDPPYPGFRVLFTFHETSKRPTQTPDGQWNCSGHDNWSSFKPHLACNLVTQCSDGRDEEDCGYHRCHDQGFEVNGRCYSLRYTRHAGTKLAPRRECLRDGFRIASLSTVREYKDVTRMLWRHQQFPVVVGLYSASGGVPGIYAQTPMWEDKTVAYPVHYWTLVHSGYPFCGTLLAEDPNMEGFHNLHRAPDTWTNLVMLAFCKGVSHPLAYLCEHNTQHSPPPAVSSIILVGLKTNEVRDGWIVCPSNHTVHNFLACDSFSRCWGVNSHSFSHSPESWDIPSAFACPVAMTSLPPSYGCERGGQRVPYSLVCDHRQDCEDNSDERHCFHRPCPRGHVPCGRHKQCDGQKDCVNGDDEGNCVSHDICGGDRFSFLGDQPPPAPPAVIEFTKGCHTMSRLNHTHHSLGHAWCPETHYPCPEGYCLPVFTRCNGVYDCPDRQDEAGCDSYTCPGYYHCRGSPLCLHPSHTCDGTFHCPQADDELLCDLICPTVCTCHGLAFTCPRWFSAEHYPHLRYLKARGSGLRVGDLAGSAMLVYLSLADCRVSAIGNVSFPNMVTLDVSDNQITSLHNIFHSLPNLRALFLSNNPLTGFLSRDGSQLKSLYENRPKVFAHVKVLYLSGIRLPTINSMLGNLFPSVQELNASGCGTRSVMEQGLRLMTQLQTLDMTGCPLDDIQEDVLKDLTRLTTVYGDNYKLCCDAALLEGFNLNNCFTPMDEISSCGDLLRSNVYRGVLALFASLAIVGNLASGLFRLVAIRRGGCPGFSVFVVHLCISDFLMGLYLAVIGVADRLYQSVYVWKDSAWRHSSVCQMAGFLSLVSSEVSAFIVCLITLDRFLVVSFPLSFLHFQATQAQLAGGLCWVAGVLLAAVPFFPDAAHWAFYSQTGICVPLPVTRKQFPGHHYAFGVMIVLNFILFLIIALGQAAIFYSVRTNQMSGKQSSQDADIARRLLTIAMSDFLCWFPIGLLGLMASQDVPVSGEVSVAMAILVLPLNSAINPFLYTLNVLMEKRRRAKEDRLLKWIQAHE